MTEDDRFEKFYTQGFVDVVEIWACKETGVNYIFRAAGHAGGITPLPDRDGKPVVSPVTNGYYY